MKRDRLTLTVSEQLGVTDVALAEEPTPGAARVSAGDPGRPRYRELDSLRGLAALTVVAHHCLLIFPLIAASTYASSGHQALNILKYSPLHVFFAGHEAVVLFFTLSGFVLALPFVDGRPQSYRTFAIRRFWRLYPAYAAAVTLGVVARAAFGGSLPHGLSGWASTVWTVPVTTGEVLKHYSIVASFNDRLFDPVLWSLTHEMRISLIFPFLMVVVMRWGWLPVLAVSLAISGVTPTIVTHVGHSQSLNTLHYLLMFVCGALLARHRGELARWYRAVPTPARWVLAIACVCLYTWRWIAPDVNALHPGPADDWATTIAVVVVIVAALNGSIMRRALLHRVPLFLGDISYSLYLLHVIVLMSALYLVYGHIPTVVMLLGVVTAAVALAYLSYRFIERPSITIGRRLTSGSRARAARAPAAAP